MKLDALLNRIDNELRPDRNRYIHDSWHSAGGVAVRTSRGTKIVNTQSRTKRLQVSQTKDYAGFAELDKLVKDLKQAYNDLEVICEEISARIAARNRPSE